MLDLLLFETRPITHKKLNKVIVYLQNYKTAIIKARGKQS